MDSTALRYRLQRIEILALKTKRDTRRSDALALGCGRYFIALILLRRVQVLLVLCAVFLVGVSTTLVHASGDSAPFLDFGMCVARVCEGGAEARRVCRGWFSGGLDTEVGVECAACVEDVG